MGKRIENKEAVVASMIAERLAGKPSNVIAKRYGLHRKTVNKFVKDANRLFFYDTPEEAIAMRKIVRGEMEFFAKRHGIGMRAIAERAGLGRGSLAIFSQFGKPLGIRKDTVRKLRAAMAEIEKESKK